MEAPMINTISDYVMSHSRNKIVFHSKHISLTPDEAIDAFKAFIDQIAKGKERDKIRIILK